MKQTMTRLLIYLTVVGLVGGCGRLLPLPLGSNYICVGDQVADVQAKIRLWGAKEALFDVALPILENESPAARDQRISEIRKRDAFAGHPFYFLRRGIAMEIHSQDGVIISIARIQSLGPHARNRSHEPGYRAVSSTGEFYR